MRALQVLALSLSLPLSACVGLAADDTFGRSDSESGGVEGSICLPNAVSGVSEAVVSVFIDEDADGLADGETADATTVTDLDGTFVFEDLTAGSYVAVASRGHFSHTFPFTFIAGNRAELTPECLAPDEVNITQVTGSCDNPKLLLERVGFDVTTMDNTGQDWLDLLTNANDIDDVDVLLLPCGLPEDWLPQAQTVTSVVGQWLENGGSLYVSGTAWPLVETLDEEAIDFLRDDTDFDAPEVGFANTLNARIADTGLAAHFTEGTASIRLADNFPVLESVGGSALALVDATVSTVDFETVESSPLAVSRPTDDGGTLVYSVFGTTGESTEDMEALLLEMLLNL
ncbi:MAG: hypothetical protein KDA24_06180 [Deltaproteobacteria bacterium]|nr:hypothetical protein [Deltaproteobacteria bacterium]